MLENICLLPGCDKPQSCGSSVCRDHRPEYGWDFDDESGFILPGDEDFDEIFDE